jgi:hypothetical protein
VRVTWELVTQDWHLAMAGKRRRALAAMKTKMKMLQGERFSVN